MQRKNSLGFVEIAVDVTIAGLIEEQRIKDDWLNLIDFLPQLFHGQWHDVGIGEENAGITTLADVAGTVGGDERGARHHGRLGWGKGVIGKTKV